MGMGNGPDFLKDVRLAHELACSLKKDQQGMEVEMINVLIPNTNGTKMAVPVIKRHRDNSLFVVNEQEGFYRDRKGLLQYGSFLNVYMQFKAQGSDGKMIQRWCAVGIDRILSSDNPKKFLEEIISAAKQEVSSGIKMNVYYFE